MRRIDADICTEKIKNLSIEYDAETVQRCIEVLSNEPTIEAEPVRYGEWILWDGKYDAGYCICSRCKRPAGVVEAAETYKYCPFCGAKMEKI